ncbi:MAG TPA: Holliday junction resolvase RuvX [Rhodospirillaceae bacterium]|nr:Holliday junction resolvase RuvX [Rhodospirillaceae bacterium]
MTLLTPDQLFPMAGRHQRLLGLDMGSKTIGLALSDVSRTIASPLQTLQRTKFTKDVNILFQLIDKHDVAGLVIGYPVSLDGSEGPACQSVRQFANNLLGLRDIPLALWDERLSTAAVTRTLLEADASRRQRAQVVDKMAAAYILQGALDFMGRSGLKALACNDQELPNRQKAKE